jgi:hypothetical protein
VPDDAEPTDDLISITDEQLTALALAADPDPQIPDDAVPFGSTDGLAVDLLPSWYMPAPSLRRSPKRTIVFAGLVFALLLINVMGLCVTYGVPDPVWK